MIFAQGELHGQRSQTGEKALELYEKYGARVIVLDIMLPGMNGFSVCSRIRETSNTHILIASAKVEKNDKLKGTYGVGSRISV
mgnify:CR=1 FL=1